MRIAITGSSGLIGTALTAALEDAGHELLRVVRHAPTGAGEVAVGHRRRHDRRGALEGVEAIVHLAGENIGQRWSDDVQPQGARLARRTGRG